MMDDYLDARLLCLQLLGSIREYEARINELITVLDYHAGFVVENERRLKALARLESLLDTREKLIESFYKVSNESKCRARGRDSSNPFDNITAEYVDLKTRASKLLNEYK